MKRRLLLYVGAGLAGVALIGLVVLLLSQHIKSSPASETALVTQAPALLPAESSGNAPAASVPSEEIEAKAEDLSKFLPSFPAQEVSLSSESIPKLVLKSSGSSFARSTFKRGEKVSVTVQYPLSMVGQKIFVQPLDGGTVNGKTGQTLAIDPQGTLSFRFELSQDWGTFQVLLDHGKGGQTLHFWVDEPTKS